MWSNSTRSLGVFASLDVDKSVNLPKNSVDYYKNRDDKELSPRTHRRHRLSILKLIQWRKQSEDEHGDDNDPSINAFDTFDSVNSNYFNRPSSFDEMGLADEENMFQKTVEHAHSNNKSVFDIKSPSEKTLESPYSVESEDWKTESSSVNSVVNPENAYYLKALSFTSQMNIQNSISAFRQSAQSEWRNNYSCQASQRKRAYNDLDEPMTPGGFCNKRQEGAFTLRDTIIPTMRTSKSTRHNSYNNSYISPGPSPELDKCFLSVRGNRNLLSFKDVTSPVDSENTNSSPRKAHLTETSTSPFVRRWTHKVKNSYVRVVKPDLNTKPPSYLIPELHALGYGNTPQRSCNVNNSRNYYR